MKLTSLLALSTLLVACAPDPTTDDLHARAIVGTGYSPTADFKSYTTFAIVDQIPISRAADAGLEFLPPASGDPIIAATIAEMTARGYTQVDKAANPDLGLQLSATKNQIIYGYYDPYYWYGGWYGWGWYYPVYPPVYYGSYDVGTLLVEMVDLKNAPARPPIGSTTPPENITVIFASAIYGVLASNSTYNTSRAVEGVQRSFEQTPNLSR